MLTQSFLVPRATMAAVAAAALWAVPAGAQEAGARFEPRFIDTSSYRDEQVLLYDWPDLTALIRWSAPVAEAVARDDGTLSAELIGEFRERVTALAEGEPPEFLAAESDSVASTLERIVTWLDAADSMAAAELPPSIADPTGEARPNVSDRERTYATGPTAVRVPAGVDVGGADTLPGASIETAFGEPTYVDLVAESLAELDALVHIVRKLGEPAAKAPAGPATPAPAGAAPKPQPGTAQAPREP